MKKRNNRQIIALAFAIATTFGLTATNANASSDDHHAEKAIICHIPPGNPANMHTIEVGEPAVEAHMAHGDMIGYCAGDSEAHAEGYESEELTGSPIPAPVSVYSMRSIYGQ